MSGPNVIYSTDKSATWDANDYTKILLSEDGPNLPPKSLVTAVNKACDKGGQLIAFAQKVDGNWKEWTFREYYNDIMITSRAFIKLGLEERHSVCISGFNSPEWFLSQMGAIFVGGIVCFKIKIIHSIIVLKISQPKFGDKITLTLNSGSWIISNQQS